MTSEEKRAEKRAYYAANKVSILAYQKERYEANKGPRLAYSKAYREANRASVLASQSAWYFAHKEQVKVERKAYCLENREKIRARNANWRIKNREKVRERSKKRQKERCESEPNFKLTRRLRYRTWAALKGLPKADRTFELLGCSIEFLREHLQKQFRPGMTWENYGPIWHVDHIKPCAKFDLTDLGQQKICFHFSNLQPLFAQENQKKWARFVS